MHSQASKEVLFIACKVSAEVLFIACKVSAEVYFMPPKAKGDIVLTCSSFQRYLHPDKSTPPQPYLQL
jgi:peroxiredoxin family protein